MAKETKEEVVMEKEGASTTTAVPTPVAVATPVGEKKVQKIGKDKKINKKNIIDGRYCKVEKKKYIVSDNSGQGKIEFSGIHPMKVTLAGKDGEYYDFKCTRYLKFRGKCDEEVELDQYQYNALRNSTRPTQKKVTLPNGSQTTIVVSKRNWSLEEV